MIKSLDQRSRTKDKDRAAGDVQQLLQFSGIVNGSLRQIQQNDLGVCSGHCVQHILHRFKGLASGYRGRLLTNRENNSRGRHPVSQLVFVTFEGLVLGSGCFKQNDAPSTTMHLPVSENYDVPSRAGL